MPRTRLYDSADADLTAIKGAQTARALGTQDLKDSGRQTIVLVWEEAAGTAGVESALTNFFSGVRAGTGLGAATSYTVQTGKTLRIQTVVVYVKATSTVINLARLRIRQAATVANNSPIIFEAVLSLETATAAAGQTMALCVPIPEGMEVGAGQQITFTWLTAANTCTVGMTIIGYEY